MMLFKQLSLNDRSAIEDWAWLKMGWQSVISQRKTPWNTPPWLGIEPGPRGRQTVSYPTELSWLACALITDPYYSYQRRKILFYIMMLFKQLNLNDRSAIEDWACSDESLGLNPAHSHRPLVMRHPLWASQFSSEQNQNEVQRIDADPFVGSHVFFSHRLSMVGHWPSPSLSTGCEVSLRGDWAIFCHASSGRVGRVWSAREKSFEILCRGWELNPGYREDSELFHWAIMTDLPHATFGKK